jgi:deazaflavin-dependent oxidoreductase (nitroreductase family)
MPLDDRQRRRRARLQLVWKVINPPTRPLAGYAPWWVLLETKGAKSGLARRTPLARGPREGNAVWVNSVHGRNATWVRNIEADPAVRIKLGGRWRDGHATIHPYEEEVVSRFNAYAAAGPKTLGIDGVDPALIRIELRD